MSNVEKNTKIKATLLATKKRRETQKCFVFSTKIDYRRLNKLQKEQLQMLFVEAKWVYNDIINHLESGKLSSWNDKKKLKTMDNVTVLSRFAPTTKLCFHCGEVHNEIKVWDRVFRCDCGVCMDRDIHAAQCMVWMYLNDFQIHTEHRNTMQAENKTSGKYSSRSDKKKAKSRSLKFEAHPLKRVGSSL